MGTVPTEPLARIAWYENHDPVWSVNAAGIGSSTSEIVALTTKTTAARAAYNAQQQAMQDAKAATLAYRAAVLAMSAAGTDVLKKVKAKAAVDGVSVYELAQIAPPAPPSPAPPPGMPFKLSATIDPGGALNLAWKCANPPGTSGTVYQVSRQLNSTGPFQIISTTGLRKFADASIPAGTAQVTYSIQAMRSTIAGTPNEFTVKFGVAGGGAMTASVVTAPKLAA